MCIRVRKCLCVRACACVCVRIRETKCVCARAYVCVCERERERGSKKEGAIHTFAYRLGYISIMLYYCCAKLGPPFPSASPFSLPNILYMMCLSSHANHHSVATSTHRSSHANHHSVATSTHVSRLSNRLFKRALMLTITALKANFLASKITALSEASSTCRLPRAEEDGRDRSLDCTERDRQTDRPGGGGSRRQTDTDRRQRKKQKESDRLAVGRERESPIRGFFEVNVD